MFQPDPDKRPSALNLLNEMQIIEPLVQANWSKKKETKMSDKKTMLKQREYQ
jgi:hypothetical protein